MECLQCKLEYDQGEHIPRILTSCGHTMCELCIRSLFSENTLLCPQCSVVSSGESIEKFPTNQALLAVKSSSFTESLCQKHGKTIEAYCTTDRSLLCVSCILEDGHKSHELTTIAKAASKHKEVLSSIESMASRTEQTISKEQESIEQHLKVLGKNYEQSMSDFQDIYADIRLLVDAREEEICGKIEEVYQLEVQAMQNRYSVCSEQLDLIQNFKSEKSMIEQEEDLFIVRNLGSRETLGKKACAKPAQIPKSDPFKEFSRESEAAFMLKAVKQVFTNSMQRTTQRLLTEKRANINKDKEKEKALKTEGQKATKRGLRPKEQPPQKRKTLQVVSVNLAEKEKEKFEWPHDVSSIIREDDTFSVKSFDLESLCRDPQSIIYTIAGCADRSLLSVESYDFYTDKWEFSGECQSYRTQFAGVALEDEILVIGGKQGGKRVGTSELYDRKNNAWIKGKFSLPAPRCGFAAVAKLPKLFVFGGSDGVPLKNFECYDEGEWNCLANMHNRRDELGGCIGPDNRIYALGGHGGPDLTCLSSCEVYTPDVENWEDIIPMKIPKRGLGVVALPDGIYTIGGYDGSKYLKNLDRFDTRMMKWTELAPMKTPRCTLSTVASANCQYIYAIGGFNGSVLPTVERYSVFEDKWEEVCPLQQPRFMHSSVIFHE